MKHSRYFWHVLVWVMLIPSLQAAESGPRFVDQLTAAEKAEIGVAAMTPAQVAALEAAFKRIVTGQSEAATERVRDELKQEVAKRDAVIAETRQELEQTKGALKEKESAPKESFFQRAKVLLTPGTEVEYTKLESRLATPFKGWRRGTIFQLENGQAWQVEEGEYITPTEPAGKAVTIVPGMLGSFFIHIEGVRQRPKVRLASR